MSDVIILIGEMGSGKTYSGKKLSKELDSAFFDGDTVATPRMVERVSKFKPLDKDIIDDYVYNHLGPEIFNRAEEGHLVVAQALYRNEHRLWIRRQLEERGHRVFFWLVDTNFLTNLFQLWGRTKGLRWIMYWFLNKPFFQKPNFPHEVI